MTVAVKPNPVLSVYELRVLFEDHPTVPLVVALCEQTAPENSRDLLRCMYGVSTIGLLPEWLDEILTTEHKLTIDVGVGRWRMEAA